MTTPDDLLAEAERLDREAPERDEDPMRSEDAVAHAKAAAARLPAHTPDSRAWRGMLLIAEVCKVHMANARGLSAELRAVREENRRLSLALAEEQARSANRGASLEAVRKALGDAAGQTGTLAEDVAALVNAVESVRDLADAFRRRECAALELVKKYPTTSPDWTRVHTKGTTWGDAADELERALLAGRKE